MDFLAKHNPLSLIRILGAAATTQDEQLIRRAERMEQDRSLACAELRANMLKSEAYTKMALAECKKTSIKNASSLVKLEEAVKDSEIATQNFLELRRNQAALESLDEHKPAWNKAMRDWLSAAHGDDPNVDSDNPDTLTLAKLTADYLAAGEKGRETHATAVVTYHPNAPITECLKVAYATGMEEQLSTGKTLKKHGKNITPLEERIWDVIEHGNPHLSNPYDHKDDAASAVSIVPLVATSGHRFGAIVSGPPALPDEYLASFAALAGQMFERIGKLEFVWRIVSLVQTFVEKQCLVVNKLVYVSFHKDKQATPPKDEWVWQPLEHTDPSNSKIFELPLKWKGNEPIGLFKLECSTFTPMDAQLIVLTHTVADILLEAVINVEEMELGSRPPLPNTAAITKEYVRRREGIADVLAGELSRCIKVSLTFYQSLVEAAAYCKKIEDEQTKLLMQAVVTLAGRTCKDWAAVKKELKQPKKLVDDIANVSMLTGSIADAEAAHRASLLAVAIPAAAKPAAGKKAVKKKQPSRKNASRWNLAEAYLKGIDLVRLADRSPVPVQIIIRWLQASRDVYNIGVAMATRTEDARNPLVQSMFDAVDTDRSGMVSTDEMVGYLCTEFGASSAMRFLRVLDTNSDGLITQAEWHESWRSGQFDVEASSPTAQDKVGSGPPGAGLRLLSRHLSHEHLNTTDAGAASQSDKPSGKPAKKGSDKVKGGGSRDRIAPEPEIS